MDAQKKLIIALLLTILSLLGSVGGFFLHNTKKAIAERSGQWLDIRLAEALEIVKKHETILHTYGLENIPASIVKAQLDALEELSSLREGRAGVVFITDHTGVIVAHPDKYFTGTDAGKSDWFRQLRSHVDWLIINNVEYLVRYQFYATWNWFLIAAEPEETVFQSIERQTWALVILSLAAIAAVFCLSVFFFRRFFKPLGALTSAMQHLEKGHMDNRIPYLPGNHFTDLTHTFNHMAQKLSDWLVLLEKKQAYFTALFEHATDLITITDRRGRFTFVSPSVKRIMGYSPDELIGEKVSQFIDPAGKERLKEHFRLGMLSDVAAPPEEFKMKHKDGTWCTFESISKDLLSHPDVNGFVTTSRNINRRKSTEKSLVNAHADLEKQTKKTLEELARLKQNFDSEQRLRKNREEQFHATRIATAGRLTKVSDKIRSHLNIVTGFGKILPAMTADKEIHSCLEAVNQSAAEIDQHLLNMISLYQADADLLKATAQKTPIHHLLNDIYRRYNHPAIEKPVSFTRDLDARLPDSLVLDRTLLYLTLCNLSDLAMDITQSGCITLCSRQEHISDDRGRIDLVVTIKLSGENLTGDIISSVCGRHSEKALPPEADLPLNHTLFYLCQRFVHLMGGTVQVNLPEAQTAAFSIHLPNVAVCRETACGKYPGDTLHLTGTPLKGIRILIADESKMHGFMLSKVLAVAGAETFPCDGGGQLIRLAREQAHDIILMSSHLLSANGINTLSLLRQQSSTKSVPVVLIVPLIFHPEKFKENTWNDSLARPIDIPLLYHKIVQLVKPDQSDPD